MKLRLPNNVVGACTLLPSLSDNNIKLLNSFHIAMDGVIASTSNETFFRISTLNHFNCFSVCNYVKINRTDITAVYTQKGKLFFFFHCQKTVAIIAVFNKQNFNFFSLLDSCEKNR